MLKNIPKIPYFPTAQGGLPPYTKTNFSFHCTLQYSSFFFIKGNNILKIYKIFNTKLKPIILLISHSHASRNIQKNILMQNHKITIVRTKITIIIVIIIKRTVFKLKYL